MLIHSAELKKYPGVGLEIYYQVDLQKVVVTFSFYQENEKGLSFIKKYPSEKDALNSIQLFVSSSAEHEDIQSRENTQIQNMNHDDFVKGLKRYKLLFLSDITENKVDLPDGGQGFIFEGDREYIKKLVSNYKFD